MFLWVFAIVSLTPLNGQPRRLTLDVENRLLSEVLKMIEQGTDYTFFINESRIDLTIPVSDHVTDGELNAVLDQVLARTPYEYAIKSRQILLSLREHSSASAPSGQAVEGVVKDKAGNPLIGASIVVECTTEGTTSGPDGAFRIVVAGSSARLVVSYLGYETQTVSVGGRTYLTVEMAEDATLVSDVVVIGYGKQTKKTLTGAVSVVGMSDLETATVSNISQALAGKAAGLSVRQMSAQPGGGSKLRIRGEASPGAGNEPLIVIDGFPISSTSSLGSGTVYSAGNMDNVLESLNPDDIESISVLKDAASTAIYGARAGHGVILITTKRGREQRAGEGDLFGEFLGECHCPAVPDALG